MTKLPPRAYPLSRHLSLSLALPLTQRSPSREDDQVLDALIERPARSAQAATKTHLHLTLFVLPGTFNTDRALIEMARAKARANNDEGPAFDLTVIDICEHPEIAEKEHIIATPSLTIRCTTTGTARRLVGTLSDLPKQLENAHDECRRHRHDAPDGLNGR